MSERPSNRLNSVVQEDRSLEVHAALETFGRVLVFAKPPEYQEIGKPVCYLAVLRG